MIPPRSQLSLQDCEGSRGYLDMYLIRLAAASAPVIRRHFYCT